MSDEAARVIDLYERHAATWARERSRDLVLARLLSARSPERYFSGRVGTTQKPCASMPKVGLNLLRKFSKAIAAVSSTICGSVNCFLSSAKNASSTC